MLHMRGIPECTGSIRLSCVLCCLFTKLQSVLAEHLTIHTSAQEQAQKAWLGEKLVRTAGMPDILPHVYFHLKCVNLHCSQDME